MFTINFFPPATIVIYDLLIKMNVCLLGVVMAACRLTVLYRFNVMKTPTEQLRNLINYKRCIHDTHHDVNVEL